jgi:iron complex transport system substrate-binding protein
MHHTIRRSLLTLFLTLIVSSCQSRSSNPEITGITSFGCQTVNHDFGETEICSQPQRVVALDPQSLDLLLALGIGPVGYAEDRRALVGEPQAGQSVMGIKYLGDRLTTRPVHVGTAQSPSLETILGLKPDLILGSYLGNIEYQTLSQIAPTLLPLDLNSPDQWREKLQILGQALQREEKASAVLRTYDQHIDRAKANLADYQGQTILLLSMSGLDHIGIFTNETFAGQLLEALGFSLLVPSHLSSADGEVIISPEILPQFKPNFTIVMASGNSQVAEIQRVWQETPVLQALPVYQNSQVYFVDYQLWSRITGPIAAELIVDEVQEFLNSPENDAT